MNGIFKWGIVGVGNISRSFADGVRGCRTPAAVVSVYSRRSEEAAKFAKDYGAVPYPDFQQFLQSDLDGVYIATPPAFLEEFAVKCIRAKIPVLVEKPFSHTSSAAVSIVATARQMDVFCMMGMWTRFLPLITEIKRLVDRGVIGEVKSLRADFMGASIPDSETSQFRSDKGGGALFYRGVYPVSLSQLLLGDVLDFSAFSVIGQTGVDEEVSLILKHNSGALSSIRASLRCGGRSELEINGTLGSICVKGPIMRPHVAFLALDSPQKIKALRGSSVREKLRGANLIHLFRQLLASFFPRRYSGEKSLTKFYMGNGFAHEAEEFMKGIRSGAIESEIMPLDETLATVELLENIKSSWTRDEN
jgi:predicted dehydrogenase